MRQYNGDFTVNFTPPSGTGSYTITYWYWLNSRWNYKSRPYAGSSMTLTEGTAIDEVRIFPADANFNGMTTYTYYKGGQPRSVTDINNLTTTTDYDDHGRVLSVSDSDKNIIRSYRHNNVTY